MGKDARSRLPRQLPRWLLIELARDRRSSGDDLAEADSIASPEEWGPMGIVDYGPATDPQEGQQHEQAD